MSDDDTIKISLEEVVRRVESEGSGSDWERIDALTDEEITEAVRQDPDQEILTREWFRKARLVIPGEKTEV